MKTNCWEYTKCGRHPGGENNNKLGVCPVATETAAHGVNHGINGGRACWAIKRKHFDNVGCCSTQSRVDDCLQCPFYAAVRNEEGEHFVPATKILSLIKPKAMACSGMNSERRASSPPSL